jgi:transcription elongation GreA/GreB family factor
MTTCHLVEFKGRCHHEAHRESRRVEQRVAAESGDMGGRTPSQERRVDVGSRVLVFDGYGEVEFVIVPDQAARIARERHISVNSPLGRALLGRKVGEQVMVRTRMGIHFVRIRDVA